MAIRNHMCKGCSHFYVCKIADQIVKFSEEQKKPLGVDIEMLKCQEYEGDGEVYNEI